MPSGDPHSVAIPRRTRSRQAGAGVPSKGSSVPVAPRTTRAAGDGDRVAMLLALAARDDAAVRPADWRSDGADALRDAAWLARIDAAGKRAWQRVQRSARIEPRQAALRDAGRLVSESLANVREQLAMSDPRTTVRIAGIATDRPVITASAGASGRSRAARRNRAAIAAAVNDGRIAPVVDALALAMDTAPVSKIAGMVGAPAKPRLAGPGASDAPAVLDARIREAQRIARHALALRIKREERATARALRAHAAPSRDSHAGAAGGATNNWQGQ